VELPFIVAKKGEQVIEEAADLRPDFSDLAVCVVDDDPLQLEAMATALEQFGVVPPKLVFSAIQEVAHSRESCAYGVFNDGDGSIWINHVGGVLRFPARLMNLLRRRRVWSFGRYVTSGTGVCSTQMWATEDR